MSRRRKWIIWLSFVGAVAGLIYLMFRDERPPDVSDLIVARRIVPESDNALPGLIEAAALMQWSEETAETLMQLRDTERDSLAARKVVADNEPALKRAKEALDQPEFQFEEITTIAQPFPYLSNLTYISRLQVARARLLFYDGELDAALAQLTATIRFGRQVQAGDGALIHWLVGITIEASALNALKEVAIDPSLSPDTLSRLIEPILTADLESGGFEDSMRNEYRFLNSAVDLVVKDPSPLGNMAFGPSIPAPVLAAGRTLFRPNRTRRMFAEATREVIAASRIPYAEFESRTPKLRPTSSAFPALQYLSTNATGKWLFGVAMPVYATVTKKKSEIATRRAMTATLLALRCHWLDLGTLPERLEELVPEYLPAVPLDDFDGKPLRYSREKRRLWSIGSDLIDHGGAENPDDNKQQKLEPTIALDWAQ